MKILLNFIGILIFFLNKFNGRKDKTTEPSIKFWFKDNWPELVIISLFDMALMILLVFGGLKLDFTKLLPSLPDGVTVAGDWAACFLIGLFLAWAFYALIKKKVEDSK
jgi:hypothetical protein